MKKNLTIMGLTLVTMLTCAALFLNTGCKTRPTPDSMRNISFAVGVSTGLICNETSIDNQTRNAICEIMGIVRGYVPATNETFEARWMPIAKDHVQKLIDQGKIDAKQGELIVAAFRVVVKGIDYLFYRYPEAKAYEELVVASIDGFCDGFLTVFRPINPTALCRSNVVPNQVPYDEGAYLYLKAIQNRDAQFRTKQAETHANAKCCEAMKCPCRPASPRKPCAK